MKIMKILKYYLSATLLIICFFGSFQSMGQTVDQDKSQTALDEGQYVKALKYAERAVEDELTSKDAYSYILKAQALFYISQDDILKEKFPDALKNSVKTTVKAFKKADKDGTLERFKEENSGFLFELKDGNNGTAYSYFKLGKYSKALVFYKNSYDMAKDTFSYYMIGKCYLKTTSYDDVLKYFTDVAKWNAGAFDKEDDGYKSTYQVEPFSYLAEYYYEKDSMVKARYYAYKGLEIFPDDYRLHLVKYNLVRNELKYLPPSFEYLDKVQEELDFFPSDSFMLHKENAVYLYLIRQEILLNPSESTDSLIDAFARVKQNKFDHKRKRKILEYDRFVKDKKQKVRFLMMDYYSNFGHTVASNYLFDYWLLRKSQGKVNKTVYLSQIAEMEKESSIALINQLYNHVVEKYGGTEPVKQRLDYYNTLEIKEVPFNQTADFLILNEKVVAENDKFIIKEQLKGNRWKYINICASHGDFFRSYFAWDFYVKEYGSTVMTDSLLKTISIMDFDVNYFGSRVKKKKVGGMTLPDVKWKGGNTNFCKPGTIPDSIQEKVLDRINYFRRMAGVYKPTVLVTQMNKMCQLSVMMMEANKNLNHTPPQTWKCWTTGGANAAANSLLTENSNSTLAVTSFMKDNKDFVGNRRWLLNPYAKGMGHGSTYKYCAIWAMNLSNIADSAYYKDNFVAWPGKRATPKMLAFDNWSFSLHKDMNGAKVTMTTSEGFQIEVNQFDYKPGYGLPTLVWKPEIDLTQKGDLKYIVEITLADGEVYKYDVMLIDHKPELPEK
jgi:tetratricopeptide (TPR) repeat protein